MLTIHSELCFQYCLESIYNTHILPSILSRLCKRFGNSHRASNQSDVIQQRLGPGNEVNRAGGVAPRQYASHSLGCGQTPPYTTHIGSYGAQGSWSEDPRAFSHNISRDGTHHPRAGTTISCSSQQTPPARVRDGQP